MADINDLFDAFPDYNVFDDSAVPPRRKRSPGAGSNRNPKNAPHNAAASADSRSNDEYGDGFGIYVEQREIRQNFSTVLFFPLLILCLEGALRLSCNQSFFTVNLLYVFLFSLPPACIFTLLCTFTDSKLNRHFVRLSALIITLWYCMQIIYRDMFGTFLIFSAQGSKIPSPESFVASLVNQKVPLLIAVVPLIFFTFFGRFTFPFGKIKIPAKIVLILLAVLFQITGLVAVNFSGYFSPESGVYSSYYGEFSQNEAQESFGLLSMEELDIARIIRNSSAGNQ